MKRRSCHSPGAALTASPLKPSHSGGRDLTGFAGTASTVAAAADRGNAPLGRPDPQPAIAAASVSAAAASPRFTAAQATAVSVESLSAGAAAGTWLIACSASAAIVRLGFTPG